jgi:hypothetical protein
MSTNRELIQELQEQNKILQDNIAHLKKQVKEGEPAAHRDTLDDAIAVLDDPYDVQNPFKIIGDIPPDEEFPEGQVLRWLNPRYREVRMWRGWVPLQWGDKYTGENGEKLKALVAEPPHHMQGPDRLDSYVRRGDTILGRLDKRIWDARQSRRVLEDARRRGRLEDSEPVKLRSGVYLTGDGIKRDEDPKYRREPGAPEVPFDERSGEGTHRTQLTKTEE